MGEKQKSHECDHKKKKKGGGDGGENAKSKKEDQKSSVTVVLKVEMHCEGCASKIIKCVRSFEGVESVKADWEGNKLTVTGKVDPAKIRDKLAEKTKKKVDLVSPLPKKDDNKKDAKGSEKKSDDKKPKEPPVTTAVLKLSLHCQGCIDKINRVLSKTNGIQEKCIDRQKDLVTVKGTMDAKALAESLKKNLKRNVEIVPPKKEKESSDKEKEKEAASGGGKKGKGGGGGGGKEENGGGGGGGAAPKMEGNRMEYMAAPAFGYAPADPADLYGFGQPYPYPNPYTLPYPYPNHPYVYSVPDQQMFSDENPNACSVM